MEFVLTPEQIFVLQWVAQGISQGIKIVWVKLLKQPKPRRERVLLVVYAVSVGVAYFWSDVRLEAPSDPVGFTASLLAAATAIFAAASVIYERLSEGVLRFLDRQVVGRIAGRAADLLAPL